MSASRLTSAAIKIPKRIERGPTDILKALASTVKHIPTEPDQLLHDDPYLLPIRPLDRSMFSLSRLSGKNTARFLLNKHPEIFHRDLSEPKVRCFAPPEEFREDMVFDEGDVKWCIDNHDPVNGIIAYNALEKANVTLTKETLLDFFEMLCYTNEEKLKDPIEYQIDFFSRDSDRDLVKQTWNTNGLVSRIFNQLKEEPEAQRIYSAMIAGLSRYNEHVTAKQVFDDFKEFHPDKGLLACAYNGLLCSIPNLCSSNDSAGEAVGVILGHMEQHLVKPDLLVLNSLLSVYRYFNCDDVVVREALKLVNDMRSLGIEPSLCTYENIISIACRTRSKGTYVGLIGDILDHINSHESILTVRDTRDLEFLFRTMRRVTNQLNSLTLAYKVHRIFMKSPNMFESIGRKQGYLDTLFRLIVTTERMEDIWKFYTTYVPNNFRPTPDTYDVLVEALDLFQADESIIKRVGSDIVEFRLADKIKDDALFKKDPDYLEKLSQSTMDRRTRRTRQRELLDAEQ